MQNRIINIIAWTIVTLVALIVIGAFAKLLFWLIML